MRQGRRGAWLALRIAVGLGLLAGAGGARAQASLTTADLVKFLRAGISEHTILLELQGRGFGESLDDAREAALREAGATETLIVAVRRAAPQPQPPATAVDPAPGAGAAPSAFPVQTFTASTRAVRVPVSVLDRSGDPVLGLEAADFRVKDGGKSQAITLFSSERRAMRIALALDMSGSMENKLPQVQDALKHFIEVLEPADQILVLTFSDRVQVLQDFTSDQEQLGRMLDSLEPRGSTRLYDAAYEAIKRVASLPAESKAVVLVTDGVDTGSAVTLDQLRELARRSQVPVYSLGLDKADLRHPGANGFGGGLRGPGGGHGGFPGGGGRGRWPGGGRGRGGPWGRGGGGRWPGGRGPGGSGQGYETFKAEPLEELADDTGGWAEIVKGLEHYSPDGGLPGSAALKAAVEKIAITLRHRYLIGYDPPEAKSGWRTIDVEVDRKDATARARKGYYPEDQRQGG